MPGSKSFKKPFFYSEPLKTWEQCIIALYGVITVMLFIWYLIANVEAKQAILIIYGIGSQLGLYFGLYTSLRNFKSYLIWCCFGILHLTIYFLTINDNTLQMARGHASSSLINTIVMLLIFQFLRFISLTLQHREFVAPAYGGGKDLFENKSLSGADFLIFLIYLGSWGGLSFLSVN